MGILVYIYQGETCCQKRTHDRVYVVATAATGLRVVSMRSLAERHVRSKPRGGERDTEWGSTSFAERVVKVEPILTHIIMLEPDGVRIPGGNDGDINNL